MNMSCGHKNQTESPFIMDVKKVVLERLRGKKPLFTDFPTVPRECVRIQGLEIELGPGVNENGQRVVYDEKLPLTFFNGGEVYHDNGNFFSGDIGHVEGCTPETSNPLSATIYHEAIKRQCQRGKFSTRLYCHNNDWHESTFGTHENYFTCAPREKWPKLILYLVARIAFIGAGWLRRDGSFVISQRADKMVYPMSVSTTSERGILNLRPEQRTSLEGWECVHVISGDTNMSEYATFLKMAITSLMVEALEMNALPDISYNIDRSVEDMQAVSRNLHEPLRGIMSGGKKTSVKILRIYAECLKRLFLRRHPVTDAALVVFDDVLDSLERSDIHALFGITDWATKMFLLDEFKVLMKGGDEMNGFLMSQDLEYHDLDPERGLYELLRKGGQVPRVVSDALIERAIEEPPTDTRASLRGRVARRVFEDGRGWRIQSGLWQAIVVTNGHEESSFSRQVPISDPRHTYDELFDELVAP